MVKQYSARNSSRAAARRSPAASLSVITNQVPIFSLCISRLATLVCPRPPCAPPPRRPLAPSGLLLQAGMHLKQRQSTSHRCAGAVGGGAAGGGATGKAGKAGTAGAAGAAGAGLGTRGARHAEAMAGRLVWVATAGLVVVAAAGGAGEREERVPFLVASDGVRRTVAEAMEAEDEAIPFVPPWRRFKVTRFEDTAVRVYKTVPFRPPPSWRGDINYSARTKLANFDALPTQDGSYCGVLLIKPEDEVTQGLRDVAAARAYFDERLPMFSPMITDEALQEVLQKQPSRLPEFRFAGPRLHRGASTVLLGDAIHSVKPYFGLGVNAAFEDVAVLGEELDTQRSLGRALRRYSRRRAAEARVLVSLSRSFDRSGPLGLLCFILPLILDGIFHGALPQLFAPNTLAMLQKPELSFTHIRWRKRADRALQLALLGAAATAVARVLRAALGLAARAVTQLLGGGAGSGVGRLLTALPVAAAAGAVALFLQRRAGSDVADVLAGQTTEDDKKQGAGTRPGY
eukprot:Transcript_4762.p1 GENE.Transcript_4762~~Transcript_4762.p1  ORF type:complete len:515 (-),score=176.67 Transcript_4762:94-1638(-)